MIFLLSLLGSLHCLGMCGGFASWCSTVGPRPGVTTVAYHSGRLVGYVILGGIAGAVGVALDLSGELVGIQWLSGFLLSAVLISFSVTTLVGAGEYTAHIGRLFARFLPHGRLIQISNRAPTCSGLMIGLASAVLPCAWLYTFVTIAAASGGWWGGVLVMAIFWLGTIPILLLGGSVVACLVRVLGARTHMVTAAVMLVAGLGSLLIHFGVIPVAAGPACDMKHYAHP